MQDYKQILRPLFGKNYKHELLNNLFYHPYTKIEFMQRDLMVQRKTAAKYLNMMVEERVLIVVKIGRENYYINHALMDLFLNQGSALPRQDEIIESVTDNQSLLWYVPENRILGTHPCNVYPKKAFRVHIQIPVSSTTVWQK